MSRFLVTCWPFTGHLLPQMSIAIALRERGHDVAFYSGDAVQATVAHEGFEFFAFQSVDQEGAFRTMRAVEGGSLLNRPGQGRMLPLLRKWLVDTIPDQLADLGRVLEHWRPDVLITDLSLWGPIVVLHERERIPVALSSTFMGPLIPGPDAPAFGFGLPAPSTRRARLLSSAITRATELAATPLRRRVDGIRADHGLPALGESVNRYTARLPLYLVGNIEELDYGRHDLPTNVHYVGNCLWFPPSTPAAREWLDAIRADRPWVHVTESTLAYGEPFLLRAAVEGLAEQPIEVVMTTGPQRDPETVLPSRLPSNVHVTQWLSHIELLPRCSAVITVGGKATILASLEAGVPLVLVPTTWDKPDNAQRVTRVGAGVTLPARRITPEALAGAVRQVLAEPRYRTAAEHIATRLAAAPGAAGAARLLEELAPARHATVQAGALDGGAR